MELNSYPNSCLNITTLTQLNKFAKDIENIRVNLSYKQIVGSENQESLWLITWVKIILYIILIIFSLFGNFLIILVIYFNGFMKKSTNYFILNLAVCDLAIVLSCMWIQIFTTLSDYWLLGEIFCKLNSYLQMVSVIASVLTLSAISCDRYFGIVYPLKARVTSHKTYLFITLIWLCSIVIAAPSFVYRTYSEHQWLDFKEQICDDFGWPVEIVTDENGCSVKTRPAKRIYYTTVILLLFFTPILIMSITYSVIIRKLWQNDILGDNFHEDKKNLIKKRKKVVLMLVWILVIFFICWSPLETMLLFMEYSTAFPDPKLWSHLEWISYFLAFSNAAINPFIYAGLNENYKKGIRSLKNKMFKKSIAFNSSLKYIDNPNRKKSSMNSSRLTLNYRLKNNLMDEMNV